MQIKSIRNLITGSLLGAVLLSGCVQSPAPITENLKPTVDMQSLHQHIERTYLYGEFKILRTSKNNHKLINTAKTVKPNLSGGLGLSPLLAILGNEQANDRQIKNVAKILIYRGANVNLHTQYGVSPMVMVMQLQNRSKLQYSLLQLLLKHGAKIDLLVQDQIDKQPNLPANIKNLLAKYQPKSKQK